MKAASSSSGTLAITALASGSTNVYWDDFSVTTSAVSGGQQFGYDGFGNLLSQTPIVGSAPMMNLAVNPNTNQVTSGGAVYDGAGNLTYDGTTHYAFDELNRMTGAAAVNYSYSPGENKRMAVSGTINGQPTQLLDFFLYSPNGKLMSVFGYQKSGCSWQATAVNQTNLFYLGSKALSFSENNIGSSTSATFWPYGSVNTSGSGPGGFASYWGDWSGLYYADQRYYDQNWGRFLTADPSDRNIDPLASGSFDRFAYVNGDPMNGKDPSGLNGSGPGYGCPYNASSNALYCSSNLPPGIAGLPAEGLPANVTVVDTSDAGSVTVTATADRVSTSSSTLDSPSDPTGGATPRANVHQTQRSGAATSGMAKSAPVSSPVTNSLKFCTGLQVAGSGAVAAGGGLFLVGTALDGTGVGATLGVPLQTFGTIGAVMGGAVVGVGYIGEKFGVCE